MPWIEPAPGSGGRALQALACTYPARLPTLRFRSTMQPSVPSTAPAGRRKAELPRDSVFLQKHTTRTLRSRGCLARAARWPVLALSLGLVQGVGGLAQQAPSAPTLTTLPTPQTYLVLLDAAHGGAEAGARLSDSLLEKDLTLALSVRLRSVLTAHGMAVATTRETDTDPAPEARAALANRTHPSACLLLHATASGTGVHLYTSALAPAAASLAGALHPWATAQAPFLTDSLKLSSDLREALTHAGVPVVLGSVSLQPVDSMSCPAVILEVAPLSARRGKAGLALGTLEYETSLVDALEGALEQWRADRPPAVKTASAARALP